MSPPLIEVQVATTRKGVPHANTLRAWAEAALQLPRHRTPAPHPQPSGLTLRIVGAAEGRRLNRDWRGKDKPTNVLSFPAGEPVAADGESVLLGDIVICAPVIRREAREQGKRPAAHWAHMVIHGVLHLAGYDHEKARDAVVMERVETWLLASLGFPDPYLASDTVRP